MAAVAVIPKIEQTQDLSKSTVCLVVKFGRLGNSKKVASSHVEIDADKAMIRVQKILLDSKELKDIQALDKEVFWYLEGVCLPFPAAGTRLVPHASVLEVTARLDQFAEERERLVEKFMTAYPRLCEEAQVRLRGEFKSTDYPKPAAVRAKFTFTYNYTGFGSAPSQLKEISKAIYEREAEKHKVQLKDATAEAMTYLREALAEQVTHLAERLTSDYGGKPKIFRESAVKKIQDYIDNFEKLNVVNDRELAAQVERARKVISGVTADGLRNNDGLREHVRKEMNRIGAAIDNMVINAPGRRFLDDDDE